MALISNVILQVGLGHRPICTSASKIDDSGSEVVRRCYVDLKISGAAPSNICGRHFRARSLGDQDVKWTVYEMFIE